MDKNIILKFGGALICIFLLHSCGQVGTITGGPVDNEAPKPIMEEVEPPNASLNTYPEQIVIPFDEFIALNKPSENIRVVPEDVKLEPSIKKRTLILKPISGEWKDSTTYAIYLKRAVKDITENNDSIMSFVFSTGSYIDSLTSKVKIVDAYDNKPVKDVTVGLYEEKFPDDTTKMLPRYIAVSDESGDAEFNYLMKGPFYVYAFYDENKNNYLDKNEKRAKLSDSIFADTAINEENVPQMRLMPPPPREELKIRTNEVLNPSIWSIGFGQRVRNEIEIDFLDDKIPKGLKWSEKGDSLTVFYGVSKRSDRYRMAFKFRELEDTLNKKFIIRDELEYDYFTNLDRGKLLIQDTLQFGVKEAVDTFNMENIEVFGVLKDDSIKNELEFSIKKISVDEVQIQHSRKYDSIYVNLYPNAIDGYNFPQRDTIELAYTVQKRDEVGDLIIEFDTIPPYGVLQVLNEKGNLYAEEIVDSIQSISYTKLQAGKYKFRYIIDENRDGRWNTGDIFKNKAAEHVLWFQDAANVRANWDVKIELEFIPLLEELFGTKEEEDEDEVNEPEVNDEDENDPDEKIDDD